MWLFIGLLVVLLVAVLALILLGRLSQKEGIFSPLLPAKNDGPRVLRHVIVICILLLLFSVTRWYAATVAEGKAEEWLNSYNGTEAAQAVGPIKANAGDTPVPSPAASPSPSPSPPPSPSASPTPPPPAGSVTPIPPPSGDEKSRLDAQLLEIRGRIKHHGQVMAFFYTNYFVSIVMVMIAGLIVIAALFFIAQDGWKATSSYVEAAFIVASMWAAFYGLFPPVFEQQKNITENKELFLKYKVLESEVESFPITHLTTPKEGEVSSSQLTTVQFINYVDGEMAKLGNIALGFDPTKIDYSQAITLSKPSPNANPSSGNPQAAPTKAKGK